MAFYLTVALPMIIAMVTAAAVFIAVQKQLQQRQARHSHQDNQALLWKKRLRASLSLATSFGLTWISGVLLLADSHIVFQWIFVVLVATQGIFIFYFHVYTQRLLRKHLGEAKNTTRDLFNFSNTMSQESNSSHLAGTKSHSIANGLTTVSTLFFGEYTLHSRGKGHVEPGPVVTVSGLEMEAKDAHLKSSNDSLA